MKHTIFVLLLVSTVAQAELGSGYELARPPLPTDITRTVLVEGFGSTPVLARHDAFRTAIERAIGVAITTETTVSNQRLTKDLTASYSQAHISNFAVASIEQRGNLYRTQVWVTVKSIN